MRQKRQSYHHWPENVVDTVLGLAEEGNRPAEIADQIEATMPTGKEGPSERTIRGWIATDRAAAGDEWRLADDDEATVVLVGPVVLWYRTGHGGRNPSVDVVRWIARILRIAPAMGRQWGLVYGLARRAARVHQAGNVEAIRSIEERIMAGVESDRAWMEARRED
jgi:hypothetical protein